MYPIKNNNIQQTGPPFLAKIVNNKNKLENIDPQFTSHSKFHLNIILILDLI